MKLVFASTFYYRRGGLESYLFKTKELLERKGHHIVPFATDYFENYDSEYSDYFCKYYDVSSEALSKPFKENLQALMNLFFNREAYIKIQRLVRETKPDLLQGFNMARNLSFSVFKGAKDAGVPTIMRISDYALFCPCAIGIDGAGELCTEFSCTGMNFSKILSKRCVHNSLIASFFGLFEVKTIFLLGAYNKYVDYFIAPSRFIRDIFIKHYKIPSERICYLPVFIDSSNASSADADDGYFLYAGRLSKEKGVMTLLKAIERNAKLKLIIAGAGPAEAELKAYCTNNKIGNIEFLGFQKYSDLQDLIKRCRAVILPSECYENSPNIVLESYNYYKPVIASKIGGIPEIVKDGETGFLFEPRKHEDLYSKIEYLASNKVLAADMGQRAKRLVEQEFNAAKHYAGLIEIYKKALLKQTNNLKFTCSAQ
ncbi:MAG: glycosyltransferase family 4 protein [Candidatus Omnitrophica bacterium]|nr:glycosyltransferase family 4 protein [Candidatus Omnitrophota bacterium]